MAFYKLLFEGNIYTSRETYRQVFGVWESRLARVSSIVLLDTVLYGPLSNEQIKVLESVPHTTQDLDAMFEGIIKATGKEQTLELVKDIKTYVYKNKQFVRLADITWSAKYRELPRIASVRICGRGIYVAVNAKNKDVDKPLVII